MVEIATGSGRDHISLSVCRAAVYYRKTLPLYIVDKIRHDPAYIDGK